MFEKNSFHRFLGCSLSIYFASFSFMSAAFAEPADVIMYHNDLSRSGVNANESILTRDAVNSKNKKFGKLGGLQVDGLVYGQPLIVNNVPVRGSFVTLLIVVTEHDTVYAFDTKGMQGAKPKDPIWLKPALWTASFLGDQNHPCKDTPCKTLTSAMVRAPNITPSIGITATPTVYRNGASQILYVTSMTREGNRPLVDGFGNVILDSKKIPIKDEEGNLPTGTPLWRLHALNLADGTEIKNSPIEIGGKFNITNENGQVTDRFVPDTLPGTGDGAIEDTTIPLAPGKQMIPFSPINQLSRSGLVLTPPVIRPSKSADAKGSYVVVAFSSFNDNEPDHGWVFAYDALTLERKGMWMSTPNSGDGNIWMGGGAPAVDSDGSLFFSTGNGDPRAKYALMDPPDYADSVIRLNWSQLPGIPEPSLQLFDFYTPPDHVNLAQQDVDLGSGGVLLLPDQPGDHRHLLLAGGKKGTMYLLDRDKLGGLDHGLTVVDPATNTPSLIENPNTVVQALTGVVPLGPNAGGSNFGYGFFGTPSYFNGRVYFGASADYLKSMQLKDGKLDFDSLEKSNHFVAQRGITSSISANSTSDGIVWYLDPSAYLYKWDNTGIDPTTLSDGPAVLYAYSADDLSEPLYESDLVAGDNAGFAVKFAVPTIANGMVFAGTKTEVSVYGLKPADAAPPVTEIYLKSAGENPVHQFLSVQAMKKDSPQDSEGQPVALKSNESVTIIDMNGRAVRRWALDFSSATPVKMDVSTLAVGFYYVLVGDPSMKSPLKLAFNKL